MEFSPMTPRDTDLIRGKATSASPAPPTTAGSEGTGIISAVKGVKGPVKGPVKRPVKGPVKDPGSSQGSSQGSSSVTRPNPFACLTLSITLNLPA